MKFNLNTKHTFSVIGVLIVGAALAWLILGTDKSQQGDVPEPGAPAKAPSHVDTEHHGEKTKGDHADDKAHADEEPHEPGLTPQKGPHAGKLFTQDGYGVEVTIFEQGVEPEFRVYTYQDGKPLDPVTSQVTLTLDRLGRPPQTFTFVKEKDYLIGETMGLIAAFVQSNNRRAVRQ